MIVMWKIVWLMNKQLWTTCIFTRKHHPLSMNVFDFLFDKNLLSIYFSSILHSKLMKMYVCQLGPFILVQDTKKKVCTLLIQSRTYENINSHQLYCFKVWTYNVFPYNCTTIHIIVHMTVVWHHIYFYILSLKILNPLNSLNAIIDFAIQWLKTSPNRFRVYGLILNLFSRNLI